jgi:hypothetical protein
MVFAETSGHARDEVRRITVYLAGGPRLKMRTCEPQDRAPWTLAASVPQAGIDYDAWSVIVATRTRSRYARFAGETRLDTEIINS